MAQRIPHISEPLIEQLADGTYKINDNWHRYLDSLSTDLGKASSDIATAITQGKHTIWVPAGAMIPRVGSPELNTTTIGGTPYQTVDFDPSSVESACFTIAMPKSWDLGTVSFVPVWSHSSTTTNFGVEWWIRGNAISDGDDGDVTPGGQVSSVDTGGTTDAIYQGPESNDCTIQDTPAANDLVWFEVFRNTGGASDTLAVDARLHGVKLFYTVNAGDDS